MHDETQPTSGTTPSSDLNAAAINEIDPLSNNAMAADETDFENLKRWGFQQAIKYRHADFTAEQAVSVYKTKLSNELKRLEELHEKIQSRYDAKIESLKAEKTQLHTDSHKEDPTLNELKDRKTELEEKMKEIKEKIRQVRQKLISGKEDMLEKWLQDARKQIDEITSLNDKIYEDTKAKNKRDFDDGKLTIDAHIKQWTQHRVQYQDRLNEVTKKLKLIGADGMNPFSANLLIGIGSSVAGAAGYFFSAFTSAANFGNQDAFYFFLSGLFRIGGATDFGLLIKGAFLLSFVIVVGVISFACYKLFNKFFFVKGSKRDGMRLKAMGRSVNDNHEASGELKAGNWFSFWLQVAPAVIIVGVIILLLAHDGSAASEVNRVNSSIEGLLSGTAVALGICGIMCIYVMKVIEPRLLRRQEQESSGISNWLKFNWEIAVCILFFFVITLAIVFYPMQGDKLAPEFTNAVAVPEFIAVSMLAAFPFAYGVRFRGLVSVSRFLQREIVLLDIHIAEYSAPERPGPGLDYAKATEMLDNVLAALYKRALVLHGINTNEDVLLQGNDTHQGRWLAKFMHSISKRINKFIESHREQNPLAELTRLEHWEKQYFPEVDEEIKMLALEHGEFEAELKKVNDQIDKLKATSTINEEDLLEKQAKLQKDIETLLTYKEKAQASKNNNYWKVSLLEVKAETAILDGFQLGMWYRENHIGPSDGYYLGVTASPNLPVNPSENKNIGESKITLQ